ncbi:fixR [Symbiodinium pilosum]|uniref:FixR protein n=1 Tax=Symbiodinium pilosum TaxID=2952 RepID=A0A812TUC2_SYMPI|nr:fixR [Symbiodinium pilosum]
MLEAAQSPGSPACVINISSIDGMRTPPANTYSYSTSKTGLIALTRHLARDLGPRNITVNAISPGPFFSRMLASNYRPAYENWQNPDHPEVKKFKAAIAAGNPLRRLGETFDIAGTTIFLISRAGSYVNGATINVDGGVWIGPKL